MVGRIDSEAVQKRIEAELARRKRQMRVAFAILSLVMYVALLIFGWAVFLSNGGTLPSANIPGTVRTFSPLGDAMMLVSVAGLVPLLLQLISAIMETRFGERQLRDQVTGRILAQELLNQPEEIEKQKRAMRLTDDGELEEVPAEEADEASTAQTARRG